MKVLKLNNNNLKKLWIIFDERFKRDWYWLGFNDRGSKGYQWTDGTGDDYTNWAAGQPEKTSNFEECSLIINNNNEVPYANGIYDRVFSQNVI